MVTVTRKFSVISLITMALVPFSASMVFGVEDGETRKVSYVVDPANVLNRIDEKVYGHFFEHIWDNAFINFDQSSWFPAPNYVVMQLWRNHYAPSRIAMEGSGEMLNTVATKSQDGKIMYLKCINTGKSPAEVSLSLAKGASIGSAALELVAPGSLAARNTLDQPGTVAAEPASVNIDNGRALFTLPALSAGVVTFKQ